MPKDEKRFADVLVADVDDKIVRTPSIVKEGTTVKEAIDQMLANPVSRKVYVVDDHGKYMGTISTETILRLMGYRVGVREAGGLSFYRFLRDTLKENVRDIMVKGKTVSRKDKLTTAMKIMIEDHLNDLPVVDEEGKLMGELVSLELLLEGKRVFEPKEWSPTIQ